MSWFQTSKNDQQQMTHIFQDCTIDATFKVYNVDSSENPITITFSDSWSIGHQIIIVKTSKDSNLVKITGNINGSEEVVYLTNPHDRIQLIKTNTNT